jgi:hypothetical protein
LRAEATRIGRGLAPVLTGADLEEEAERVEERFHAGEVGLVDEEEVADLEDPGLEGLDDVAGRRLEDENDQVGAVEDVELGLADPHGLDEDAVHAEGVEDIGHVRRRGGEAAVALARGQGADEDAAVVERRLHPDPVAEEGPPGERARRVDGDDRDGVAVLEGAPGEGGRDRALAHAGGARDPDPDGAPLPGDEQVTDGGDGFGVVLDEADQAGAGQTAALEEFLPERRVDGRPLSVG